MRTIASASETVASRSRGGSWAIYASVSRPTADSSSRLLLSASGRAMASRADVRNRPPVGVRPLRLRAHGRRAASDLGGAHVLDVGREPPLVAGVVLHAAAAVSVELVGHGADLGRSGPQGL